MAITPYVRIPYASERDRYTGRAYTAQQLSLMQRRDASESAYARDRAQRMSDRWSGFGGLVTETLGDLRQSREVREAQALEQARYDEEQARLKRIEDEGNRRFGVEEDWRRERQTETDEYREYVELKNMPPDKPFNERQIYLWNKFNPGSLRTEAGAPGRVFGDPATAPPPARDGTNVSLGPEVFRSEPAQMGERAFGGLFPATSGGETLAGVARGTRDRETGVDLGIAPDARFFAPTPGPAGPTQTYRPQSAEEARFDEGLALDAAERTRAEAARVAALQLSEARRLEDIAYREHAATDARRRFDIQQGQRDETFTPGLPQGVMNYLAALRGRQTFGQGDVPGGTQTGPPMTKAEVLAEVFGPTWQRLTEQHENLNAVAVRNAIDALWPDPRSSSGLPYEFGGGGVFGGGGEGQLTSLDPDAPRGATPQLTAQQQSDLVTRKQAEVLVERGLFATIPEALQSIAEARDSENPEVPVLEVPQSPQAAVGASPNVQWRRMGGEWVPEPTATLGETFAPVGRLIQQDPQPSRAQSRPVEDITQYTIESIPSDASKHGGLRELYGYVLRNRDRFEEANIDTVKYLEAVVRLANEG